MRSTETPAFTDISNYILEALTVRATDRLHCAPSALLDRRGVKHYSLRIMAILNYGGTSKVVRKVNEQAGRVPSDSVILRGAYHAQVDDYPRSEQQGGVSAAHPKAILVYTQGFAVASQLDAHVEIPVDEEVHSGLCRRESAAYP